MEKVNIVERNQKVKKDDVEDKVNEVKVVEEVKVGVEEELKQVKNVAKKDSENKAVDQKELSKQIVEEVKKEQNSEYSMESEDDEDYEIE